VGRAGAQQLFEVGERVHALIVGMNPDGTRISLSTAELEAGDGDMLENKARGQPAARNPDPLTWLQMQHSRRTLACAARWRRQ
jgi:hypothetical protein